MFRLEVSHAHAVPVIQVYGVLDYGNTARFDEALRQALAAPEATSLIIDLAHTPTLDSAGLGLLVKSYKTCLARGGKLAITGMNAKVAKLIGVTHLGGLFEIHETLAAGLAAMVPPGDPPLASAAP